LGTSIELTVSGISLAYAKNHMGMDHGFLFQEGDRSRMKSDQISYDWYEDNPEEKKELPEAEAAFIRPLHRVLPRLDLLGYTMAAARAEYEALVSEAVESQSEYRPVPEQGFMTFDEFVAFCGRYPLASFDDTCIDYDDPDRERKSQGRFFDMTEMQRIPIIEQDLYWSERSYVGESLCILSCYAMLQVFGQHAHNADAPVVWQYGPLVNSGWAAATDFVAAARREQTILVATEGTSDVRILRRALDILQPDVADFFRFIDVNERHHFWGAGNLVKFAEGLVRIDVQNKVLFILDNDAEGIEAYRRLQALTMPTNLRALTLPDQDSFRQFPARGPEGVNACDINGRAAGIECYLDLNLPSYPPAQVIWSNYRGDLDTWQGALEHKESYMQHFFRQDDALLSGKYDTTKLRAVLKVLLTESAGLAEIPKWLCDSD